MTDATGDLTDQGYTVLQSPMSNIARHRQQGPGGNSKPTTSLHLCGRVSADSWIGIFPPIFVMENFVEVAEVAIIGMDLWCLKQIT